MLGEKILLGKILLRKQNSEKWFLTKEKFLLSGTNETLAKVNFCWQKEIFLVSKVFVLVPNHPFWKTFFSKTKLPTEKLDLGVCATPLGVYGPICNFHVGGFVLSRIFLFENCKTLLFV